MLDDQVARFEPEVVARTCPGQWRPRAARLQRCRQLDETQAVFVMRLGVDHGRAKPPRPGTADRRLHSIQVPHVAALDRLDERRQPTRVAWSRQQTELVIEKPVSVDRHPCLACRVTECAQVVFARSRPVEDRSVALSDVDEQVKQAGNDDPGQPRHYSKPPAAPAARAAAPCRYLRAITSRRVHVEREDDRGCSCRGCTLAFCGPGSRGGRGRGNPYPAAERDHSSLGGRRSSMSPQAARLRAVNCRHAK